MASKHLPRRAKTKGGLEKCLANPGSRQKITKTTHAVRGLQTKWEIPVYTNGVLAAQTVTSIRPFGPLIAGDSPGIGIGNVNDGLNNFPFVGDIDEISLYNRALTTSEVQSIFNAGSAGKSLFKYWKTNGQLRVRFQMDRKQHGGGYQNILDIRVENLKHAMSLPLGTRSKGFNWFFSFIVWFNKIQEDKKSNYVLLLDEPGLNLHASAQADLLRFIEDLSERHQIIYSTHSPFMVNADVLHRVRTIYDGEKGSTISESVEQRDSDTLFPLQAALGYGIAQNLFISKNNLLVEGPADLVYLTALSGILESEKRVGLKSGITIVPVGGLDKVATFIALLKASKLNIACMLDSFTDQSGKQRVSDLIRHKIIKEKNIRFFDEFATVGNEADIEDLFEKSEYLDFFNAAFAELKKIKVADLADPNGRILPQINKLVGKDRFNHYRPANQVAKMGLASKDLSSKTLDRFENLFKAINELF